MTSAYINGDSGLAGSTRYYLDAGTVATVLGVPAARVALDGTRPLLVRALGLYLAGRGGSRVCTVAANASGTLIHSSSFAVASAGSAGYQGARALSGNGALVRNTSPSGTSITIAFTTNGAIYFGWNNDSGNVVNHSNPAAGDFPNTTLAGTWDYEQVPTAASSVLALQLGITSAKVTWAASSDGGGYAGLTGYTVQASTSADFTTGVVSLDVGNVTEAIFTTLTPGEFYYFRVLPSNAVTVAAGTYGPASNVSTVQMVASTGNLDGWEAFGALPAGSQAVTPEGLRRGTVSALPGTPSAILKENTVTAGPVTLATNTYGAKRLVTGLTVGKVYRLEMSAAYIGTAIDGNTPTIYQSGVVGLDWGDPIEITAVNTPYELPMLEFEATDTEHEIAFRLAEAVTRPAAGELERLAVWDIRLAEIPSFSPYRLQSIVYESSLLNHFDLANNSVGARWWVDAYNVTQFAATLGTESAAAIFTDRRADGKREYVDITTSFDTRNIVNDLAITQHGAVLDETGWLADDESLSFKDLTSIATNSIRQASMDMSLYSEGDYDGSMETRVAEIFSASADPQFTVVRLRWNAQEDPDLAARLDVYTPVDVEFRGNTYPCRIVNIQHIITPKRWIMVLELDRREG